MEQSFRQTKNDDLVAMLPIRHFTDDKIRCHILSCIVALCYLHLIELKLRRAGLDCTASTVMKRMRKIHSCLCWSADKRKPLRILEEPAKDQALILNAFGYEIAGGSYKKYLYNMRIFIVLSIKRGILRRNSCRNFTR